MVGDRHVLVAEGEAGLHHRSVGDQGDVGPGPRDEDGEYLKLDVEEGDEIIFSKYGGTEIKVGADEVLVLRESDVLAKVATKGAKSSKKKQLAGASA